MVQFQIDRRGKWFMEKAIELFSKVHEGLVGRKETKGLTPGELGELEVYEDAVVERIIKSVAKRPNKKSK